MIEAENRIVAEHWRSFSSPAITKMKFTLINDSPRNLISIGNFILHALYTFGILHCFIRYFTLWCAVIKLLANFIWPFRSALSRVDIAVYATKAFDFGRSKNRVAANGISFLSLSYTRALIRSVVLTRCVLWRRTRQPIVCDSTTLNVTSRIQYVSWQSRGRLL